MRRSCVVTFQLTSFPILTFKVGEIAYVRTSEALLRCHSSCILGLFSPERIILFTSFCNPSRLVQAPLHVG